MVPDATASSQPATRRSWMHGAGEVLGFFGAAAWAVIELALGRWPSPRAPAAGPPHEAETVAPYPIHD